MTRRRLSTTLLAATALAVAVSPSVAQATSDPELGVETTSCRTGPTAADRTAVFTASMPAATGAARLALNAELQERRAGAQRFRTLRAPNFGVWQRADAGVRGYVVAKRVEQLAAGSSYRVVVRFRWYAADGTVVRRARRTSPVCRQPDVRADLRVTAIAAGPGPDAATSAYRVTLRNDGAGAVPAAFRVSLAVGGALAAPADVAPGLAPGASTVVTFLAPPCTAGTTLRAVADTAGVVEEPDEQDNVLEQACQAG